MPLIYKVEDSEAKLLKGFRLAAVFRYEDTEGQGQGVVAWDVEVTNQDKELVASYDILTLVAKKA